MSLTKAISNLSISLTNALGAKRGRPDGSSGIYAFVKNEAIESKVFMPNSPLQHASRAYGARSGSLGAIPDGLSHLRLLI